MKADKDEKIQSDVKIKTCSSTAGDSIVYFALIPITAGFYSLLDINYFIDDGQITMEFVWPETSGQFISVEFLFNVLLIDIACFSRNRNTIIQYKKGK